MSRSIWHTPVCVAQRSATPTGLQLRSESWLELVVGEEEEEISSDSENFLSREEELQVTGSVAELVSDLLRLSPLMVGQEELRTLVRNLSNSSSSSISGGPGT